MDIRKTAYIAYTIIITQSDLPYFAFNLAHCTLTSKAASVTEQILQRLAIAFAIVLTNKSILLKPATRY